jgi:integrative and conjugative element protein (TIGR02256 family)
VEIIEDTLILSNGGRIKIGQEALGGILSLIQTGPKSKEAGGVLMGRFIKEAKDIVIDKVTLPMKGDIRSRFQFKRLSPLHQLEVEREWVASKGTCNYLGEWHTHPEQDPTPSGVDLKDWERKLKKDTFSSRFLYFIIAGTAKLSIWEADRRTLQIHKLIPETTKQD